MLEIRKYRPEDYDQVIALYQNKRAYGGNYDPSRDEASKLVATAESGNLYVATNGQTVLGTFMILDNPHTFWLLRFAVDPSLENENEVVQTLFDEARGIAASRGHDSVIIYTANDNEILNKRYKALGCHKADNYRCYWKETV